MANRTLPIEVQIHQLLKIYPLSKVSRQLCGTAFTWQYRLKPTPLSIEYAVRIKYKFSDHPDVFIDSPKPLLLAPNEKTLPHVYDSKLQHICIYRRRAKVWTPAMSIADTIVPWVAEWLFYYEIWCYTGKWLGGGISHAKGKPYRKNE